MGRPKKEDKLTEQEFLEQNPSATPYELLSEGIITQKRYEELVALPEPVKQEVKEIPPHKETERVKPTIVTHKIIPELTSFSAPKGTRVYLKDKVSGKSTLMSKGSAEREKRKYPNRYEII